MSKPDWVVVGQLCARKATGWDWRMTSVLDRPWMLIEGSPKLGRGYRIEEWMVDDDGTVYLGFADFPNQWFEATGFGAVRTRFERAMLSNAAKL